MTTAIPTPERVVFVNIKDGNTFFDCSPAEARIAMKTVIGARENGDVDEQAKFRKEIEEAAVVAFKTKAAEGISFCVPHFSAVNLADCFQNLEKRGMRVSHVFMNARQYADLRKWERDILKIESKAWKLKIGVMAYCWGAFIIVVPPSASICPENTVLVCGLDNPDEPGVVRAVVTYIDSPKPLTSEQRLEEKMDKIINHFGL